MFFTKNKFKVGDFVKVKKGVKHPYLKIELDNWQGKVVELDRKGVYMELDATTLNKLGNNTITLYGEDEQSPDVIFMERKKLELSKQRNSPEEVEKAQDKLFETLELIWKNPSHIALSEKWVRHFQRSDYYFEMEQIDKNHSDFILSTYTQYMYNYERKKPKDWNVRASREVLLNWAPNKITAEHDLFVSYGKVLLKFFQFLEAREYLKTRRLQELLEEVGQKIVVNSQKSSNWGTAKSFLMKAQRKGVNTENQKEMAKFMRKEQENALDKMFEEQEINEKNNLFNKIGRNELISVKYKSGRIIENIKFKRVKQDLLNGDCKLVD